MAASTAMTTITTRSSTIVKAGWWLVLEYCFKPLREKERELAFLLICFILCIIVL